MSGYLNMNTYMSSGEQDMAIQKITAEVMRELSENPELGGRLDDARAYAARIYHKASGNEAKEKKAEMKNALETLQGFVSDKPGAQAAFNEVWGMAGMDAKE
jgi:hypothetical protein